MDNREAYIAGFTATSNLEAGLVYSVLTTGTSAHAFTLMFDSEVEAFTDFYYNGEPKAVVDFRIGDSDLLKQPILLLIILRLMFLLWCMNMRQR